MTDFTIHSRVEPKKFKSPALTAALKNLGRLPEQLGRIGYTLVNEIQRNLSGRILQRRTGRLHDSWEWHVFSTNNGWELIIDSDIVYARIHEFGGFTGRNYATKIKKSRYLSKAMIAKKTQIRRIMTRYVSKIFIR